MDLEPGEDDISAGANDNGSSESHRARTLIFVVAAGFLIVGGMSLAAYWFKCRHHHLPMNFWRCLYLSIPLVIGVAILIMSAALVRAIEDYLDE
jgi:hypothetical protein